MGRRPVIPGDNLAKPGLSQNLYRSVPTRHRIFMRDTKCADHDRLHGSIRMKFSTDPSSARVPIEKTAPAVSGRWRNLQWIQEVWSVNHRPARPEPELGTSFQ